MGAERKAPLLAVIGVAAAAVVLVFSFALGPGGLRAWLAAAFLTAGAPGGAILLFLVARLTPGRWRDGLGPSLARIAGAWPAAAGAMAPILAAPAWLYPWAAHPAGGFREAWLAQPFFALRGVCWFAILAWLSFRARAGRVGEPLAVVGLLLVALLGSLVAIDWALSLDPEFSSSGFGLYALALQADLACALGVAMAAGRGLDDRALDVLGGVLLTLTALWAYAGFMQYFIVWSGDLPPGAAWFTRRGGGAPLAWAAILLKFAPAATLVAGRVRRSPRALRRVAACIALGAVPEVGWLVMAAGPDPAGPAEAAAYIAALIALAVLAVGVERLLPGRAEAPA